MILKIIKEHKYFFVPYFLFLSIGIYFALTIDKLNSHLWLTSYYSQITDILFVWITKMAEGWFTIPILIALLFYNYRAFVFTALSYGISAGITQILKRVVFDEQLRPVHFLHQHPEFRRIKDVVIQEFNSFPSGHTTSAFSIFICLAFLVKNNYLKLLCFLAATIIAFSRVYLSQHFLKDIIAGSIVGTSISTLFYYFIYEQKTLLKHPIFNNSLAIFFRRSGN